MERFNPVYVWITEAVRKNPVTLQVFREGKRSLKVIPLICSNEIIIGIGHESEPYDRILQQAIDNTKGEGRYSTKLIGVCTVSCVNGLLEMGPPPLVGITTSLDEEWKEYLRQELSERKVFE